MLINCQFVILRFLFLFFYFLCKVSSPKFCDQILVPNSFTMIYRSNLSNNFWLHMFSYFLTFNEQTIFIFITRNFYVYREANSCADRLTRMGAELTLDHLFLCNPPPMVIDLLSVDKAGHVCNKLTVS